MNSITNIKRFIKFLYGYILFITGWDKNRAIEQYEQIAKTYTVPEQIDGYVKSYTDLRQVLEQMIDFLHEEVALICTERSFCKILDYGCGSGRYMKTLQKHNLYGIDANRYTLEHITPKYVPDAKLFHLDFTDIRNEAMLHFLLEHKESFDIIYSITVIQFLQRSKIDLWFANIAKLLKPGGYLILNFPLPKDMIDRYHIGYMRYTPEEIKKFLECYDFKIEKEFSNIYREKLYRYQSHKVDYGYNLVAKKEFKSV